MPSDQSTHRQFSAFAMHTLRLVLPLLFFAAVARGQDAPSAPATEETNPVVRSVQAGPLETPHQLARAVDIMIQLERADLATQYLRSLDAAVSSDDQWFNLARDFGSQFTLRIATWEPIQPVGRQVANKLLDATQRVVNDPARIATLTQQLADPDIRVREQALGSLLSFGTAGAAHVLNAISDAPGSEPALQSALNQFGANARSVVAGGIRSSNATVQLAAIAAARRFVSEDVTLFLLRPALDSASSPEVRDAALQTLAAILPEIPSTQRAAQMLRAGVEKQLRAINQPHQFDPFDEQIWRTHPETQKLVEFSRSPLVIRRMVAAELAEDLQRIQPDEQSRHLYLLALLEATKVVYGFELPLEQSPAAADFAAADAALLDDVLGDALARNLVGAAVGACEALAGRATTEQISGSQPGNLVRAARYHDVRVQHAACNTIVQLDPQTSFAGSSDVARTVVELARAQGQAKILVAYPTIDEGHYIAASIEKLGYRSQAVQSARELVDIAASDVDVEMVLVSDRINPACSEVIDQLRTQPRTKNLPIGIMYSADDQDFSWRSNAARMDVELHLVLDARNFPDYEVWVDRHRTAREVKKMPFLLVVKPGDSEFAFGRAGSDPGMRFIELDEQAQLVWKGLPEQVGEVFGLQRTPVCLVIQPTGVVATQVNTQASLVLDPTDWGEWPLWARLTHDNPVTNMIDVVLANDDGIQQFQSLTSTVDSQNEATIPVQDIQFIFELMDQTLNTELAHTHSYIDPTAQKRAKLIEQQNAFVYAMPRTMDSKLIARQIDRLARLTSDQPVSTAQRQQFADAAIGWLARLTADPQRYPFWNFTQHDEDLCTIAHSSSPNPTVCQMLGNLATPAAQRQLLEIAGRHQLPIEYRQAAVDAFAQAVAAKGILLTTAQISEQYQRYNASESLPAEMQTILASILDVIERKTSANRSP